MKQHKIFIDIATQTLKLYQLKQEVAVAIDKTSHNTLTSPKEQTATRMASMALTTDNQNSDDEILLKTYPISTGKNGVGCQEGTGKTPLGKHRIAKKIGEGQPINSVYIGRIATGEIYCEELGKRQPNRDWILSRILWLTGEQDGYNKGVNEQGCCDTYQRYIYIHGTPDSEPMGVPMSHGCIRMRNTALMELFDLVEEGCDVLIV